jgi:hypothetical protein
MDCGRIPEFESYDPSHAVGSLWRVYPVHGLCEQRQSRASIPAEILAYARATPAELARFPRIRAEFRPWRPLAFELQRRGYAARGRLCRDLQQAFCTDVGHHSASLRRHELAAISFVQKMIRRRQSQQHHCSVCAGLSASSHARIGVSVRTWPSTIHSTFVD